MKTRPPALLALVLGQWFAALSGFAQTTAFTYQGQLTDNGSPANAIYDLRFTIYDLDSGGVQQGGPLVADDLAVTNGLFTVLLDFTATPFNGSARWLEIAVRPGASSGAYTNLVPRQKITSTPHAIYAGKAMMLDGTLPGSQLAGTYSSAVTFSNAANSFSGSGGGLTALNASQLTSGTVPDIRLSANVALLNSSPVFTGTVTAGGDLVAGARLSVGSGHNLTGSSATIAGGQNNTNSGSFGTVSGGQKNNNSGYSATVGGGFKNLASGSYATVGGGDSGTASAGWATVGGGFGNSATTNHATVGGGSFNIASGIEATVPGGRYNAATDYAFAAGHRAKANHTGAFVWADSQDADFASTAFNQFLIRASGGVCIGTNTPTAALDVAGSMRARGLLRSGSEGGTSQAPSPAGLVVRRINSTVSTAASIVARTDSLTLERDGSSGGFWIRYPASAGNVTIACVGLNSSGTQVSFYSALLSQTNTGAIQIYTDAQNIVHFQCTFGKTYDSSQHLTQVTLSRFGTDNYWSGTVLSTYDQ